MSAIRLLGVTLASAVALGSSRASDEPPPLPSGLDESVEVRLVTIDVTALDGDDRTVADLEKSDVILYVDRKERPVDTFDVACDGGSADDPRSKAFGGWPMPPDLDTGTRRIVFAFDYLHLTTVRCPGSNPTQPCLLHTQSLKHYQDMLAAKAEARDEELMVAALTGGLRIEQPFTRDRAAVLATLRRMEHDISLWNGHFDHEHELPLFKGLHALVTLLRAVPGPKAVVLITAGLGPGEFYQLNFEKLAAVASDARVTIYPVDARGVFPGRAGPPGEPAGLWRLASSTGGRVIHNTNDPTIGYARARRDLGCRYTIGFYDRSAQQDKPHEVLVESGRKGVHLLAATRYSFPSNRERLRMAVEAAHMVPEMFDSGDMRGHVFPLQPKNASTWDALVGIDFPVPHAGANDDAARREFDVVLSRGDDAVHAFHRSFAVRSTTRDDVTGERRITFLEPASIRPGRYTVTAVLSDGSSGKPFSFRAQVTVPEIPKRTAFLTSPLFGRLSGDDLVVLARTDGAGAATDRIGDRASFRPVLVNETDRDQPLAVLTHACLGKPGRKNKGPWTAARTLVAEDGSIAGSFPQVTLEHDGSRGVQCNRLLDELDVARLRPGRYTFRATLTHDGAEPSPVETREVPFALIDKPARAP